MDCCKTPTKNNEETRESKMDCCNPENNEKSSKWVYWIFALIIVGLLLISLFR